jgi:hypothetical protein
MVIAILLTTIFLFVALDAVRIARSEFFLTNDL